MLKLCKVTKLSEGALSSTGISFSFSSILTHSNLLPPFWRRVYCLYIGADDNLFELHFSCGERLMKYAFFGKSVVYIS